MNNFELIRRRFECVSWILNPLDMMFIFPNNPIIRHQFEGADEDAAAFWGVEVPLWPEAAVADSFVLVDQLDAVVMTLGGAEQRPDVLDDADVFVVVADRVPDLGAQNGVSRSRCHHFVSLRRIQRQQTLENFLFYRHQLLKIELMLKSLQDTKRKFHINNLIPVQ